MLRRVFSTNLAGSAYKHVPIKLSSVRLMGDVATVPEGTLSSKTGLPISTGPLPRSPQDYVYEDRLDLPIPQVPFIEQPNDEQKKLLALQTRDWKTLTVEDKKQIYHLKFQWSLNQIGRIQESNNYNVVCLGLLFASLCMVSYELLGIYLWERSRRPTYFVEPRMSVFRSKVKKFMNKVQDVVNPQYLNLKVAEEEVDGLEL